MLDGQTQLPAYGWHSLKQRSLAVSRNIFRPGSAQD
ncbi:hypothetical protein Amal_03375 [Acetobacter malorum]|uniref:Uncharacterized protein n=1 Tax=Acetobacter malorum TaxID=178901 RepID=A0A177G7B8_9PROT|nr:hypothetical protein Amal_03375 [Acetobacter malorum]